MPRKILVIEDDLDMLELVATSLKGADYEVLEATEGEQGLKTARAEKPDAIVLDLAMPKMNGYEVCKTLHEDPATSHIKVIVTSAKSYPSDIKAAMSVGALFYMVKPYSIKDLLSQISKLWEPSS